MNEHLPPGTVTLPEMLKKKGFYTAVIGKFFHTVEYAEQQLMAFDRIEMYGKPPGWKGPEPILAFPPVKRRPANEIRRPRTRTARSTASGERRQVGSLRRFGADARGRRRLSQWRRPPSRCLKEFSQDRRSSSSSRSISRVRTRR